MDKNFIQNCAKAFIHSTMTYQNFERKTHFLELKNGQKLHHTEMYVLSEIKEHSGLCLSDIAKEYNVTLGAVSQIIKKLEQKGLITKTRDTKNQSKCILSLTDLGEQAHKQHIIFHMMFDEKIEKAIEPFNSEQKQVIYQFLVKLVEHINQH